MINPIRIVRNALHRYKMRNVVLCNESTYCYKCHQTVSYEAAFNCGVNRCPISPIPF